MSVSNDTTEVNEHVRRVLEKKERKKKKEEQELYKATKLINAQNVQMRKKIAQKQTASTNFMSKLKSVNIANTTPSTTREKNYMKENRLKMKEQVNKKKLLLEEKEENKKKKPFKMKKFEKVTSKVAKALDDAEKEKQKQIEEEEEENSKKIDSTSPPKEGEEEEEEEEGEGEGEGEEEGEEDEEEEEEEGDEDEYEYVEVEEGEDEEEGEEGEKEEGEEEYEYVEVEEEVEDEEEEEENKKNVQEKSDNEKREDFEEKTDKSIINKLKKDEAQSEHLKKNKFHKNFGKLPGYILKKKKQISEEGVDVPEGYRLLKNDERTFVLKELHTQLKDLNEEYKTNKDKIKKVELGKKIKEVKDSIELFSKEHVVVDENF